MKRASLLVLVAILTIPVPGHAQTPAQQIAKVVMAAPERYRDAATVIDWNADGSVVVLRQGSNGFLCYDEHPAEGEAIACTAEGNRARVEQNYAFNFAGGTPQQIQARFDAAEANGTRELSIFGSVYYHLAGPDLAAASPHVTIVVPNATAESLGLPDRSSRDRTWIMQAGTSAAHLMIPGH